MVADRVRWMDENGIRQWNCNNYLEVFPLSLYEARAGQGELFALVDERGQIAAAGALLEADEFWLDNAPALYVHSLVSARGTPGAGAAFLREAETLARQSGKKYLRLDSDADNPALGEYYRRQGFEEAGTCEDGPYRGILRQKRLC